jgi:ADP-ribose pyrophosphatase
MNFQFTRSDVRILDRKTLYQGHFQLEQLKLQYRLFRGGWSCPQLREVFERGEAVGVLLFDTKCNQLVLIEQFRPGIASKAEEPWLIEIVAGVIDKGESLNQVAIRETQEETGLEITNLLPICQYWVSPGASTERVYLFCGQVDSQLAQGIHGLLEEGEDIRLHVLSLQAAYNLLDEGKIHNSSTIIALQWLQRHEQMVRAAWLE